MKFVQLAESEIFSETYFLFQLQKKKKKHIENRQKESDTNSRFKGHHHLLMSYGHRAAHRERDEEKMIKL